LSVCTPSCVTNISEELTKLDAIDSNLSFSNDWPIAVPLVIVVVEAGDHVVIALTS
jgi:hypothetical protein